MPAQRFGLLRPIAPAGKWEHIFIDFVQDLPETAEGYRHALIIVDEKPNGDRRQQRLERFFAAPAAAAAAAPREEVQ